MARAPQTQPLARAPKKPPHRPPHEPTRQSRQQVMLLVGAGCSQDVVRRAVGVSLPTLHKHYRQELDEGLAKVEAGVRGKLASKALAGNTACLIFYCKTMLGMSERFTLQGDKNADPIKVETAVTVEATEAVGRLMAQLATAKATGGGEHG